MAEEELGITIHIGSVKSRNVRDGLRWALRAALLDQRQRLGKTTVERERDSLTVKGSKISLSMEHNNWVHFGVTLNKPISQKNLFLANILSNEIASYLNGPLKGNCKVSISTNLSTLVPMRSASWNRFFALDQVQDFEKSLKLKLKPSGLFLIQKEHSVMNSIILTLSEGECQVGAFISRPADDQIPKDFVKENYDTAKQMLRKATSVLG